MSVCACYLYTLLPCTVRSFPVESMIIDPVSRSVTHRLNANDLMDAGESGVTGIL